MDIKHLFQQQFLENTLAAWIKFILIIILGVAFKKFGTKILSGITYSFIRAYAKNLHAKQYVALLRKPVEAFLIILIIFIAIKQLRLPTEWQKLSNRYELQLYFAGLIKLAFICSITWIFLRIADFIGYVFKKRTRKFGQLDPQVILFVKDLLKVAIVIVAFFVIVKKVFHEDAAAIVTGLGIGGLAIALAAQETLANLLGSVIIFSDRPFSVGELVETPELRGIVEHVGFRSTRIRTSDRTLLTVPNKKLVDAALNNITRTGIRRIRFNVCLTYDTTEKQLRQITDELKKILAQHPKITKEFQVTFAEIQNNYIGIEVVYFVQTTSLDEQALVKEEINYKTMDLVNQSGAVFVAQNPGIIFADNFRKK